MSHQLLEDLSATICLGIANRPTKDFSKDYSTDMLKLIEYVLDRV